MTAAATTAATDLQLTVYTYLFQIATRTTATGAAKARNKDKS